MPYRILCCDGGGMRGYLTALLLVRLVERFPDLLKRVDLLAGTSSGGLIVLGLAAGIAPARLVETFETRSGEIFEDDLWDDIADVGRLVGADYATRGRERVARDLFGDAVLHGLPKRVLVPAFDLDSGADGPGIAGHQKRRWKAKIFHNYPGSDSDGDVAVWRVALWTSAAPIYFPSVDGFIDGGVVAPNPAMCALAQTRDPRAFRVPVPLDEVRLLSLGTGRIRRYVEGESHDWGALQWGRPLVDMVMSGSVEMVDYQCSKLLGEHYFRLSPDLAAPIGLDGASAGDLALMRRVDAAADLADVVDWLERFW